MVQEASVIPGVYWSRGDRRAITLAAAFCARCSGAMADLADPSEWRPLGMAGRHRHAECVRGDRSALASRLSVG